MKKYTTPEIEMVKYDVDECLGASQASQPANKLQTEQEFVNNETLNQLS